MTKSTRKPSGDEVLEHEGHTIRLIRAGDGERLYIDDVEVGFGRDDGGLYYLQAYAYDRHESLMEVARRYIDYRKQVDSSSAEQGD